MSMTNEQRLQVQGSRGERRELVHRLVTESLPQMEREAMQRRLVEIDAQVQAIEEAASIPPPPTAADIAEQARQARANEIRMTPGFYGGVNPTTGERLLGFVDRDRLQRELLALEIPGVPGPGTAA